MKCITLELEMMEIIQNSSLSEQDKKNLLSTVKTSGRWIQEQKAMYDQAVQEWNDREMRN